MNIKSRTLSTLRYSAFVLGTICVGIVLPLQQSHVAYGTEGAVEEHLPLPVAFQHFEEDKELIHQYLAQVKEVELHFFWTTGRTLSDDPDYHPNTKVDVGGAEYGQKFFPYVDKLLENSPNNLKIKFVCDAMTVKSNETQIGELHHIYGNRFEILPIEKVQENLLKTFPLAAEEINILFKNATQGSPVLTSDIYRVIGMVYGHDHESDMTQILYAYSDIDAFCYGMESFGHADLITALFNPVTESPFYFGRSQSNNDVIKLQITDIESYKDFCDRILNKINIRADVLTHFSNLHDMIKQCEKDSQNCSNLLFHLPHPIKNLMLAVTLTTGPKFLHDRYIKTGLSYPSITVGEWSAPEEALDYTLPRYTYAHPPSVLDWGSDFNNAFPGEEEAGAAFMADCNQYRKVLSAAFYAKQFGDHHPFNLAINQYLADHYPYHAPSFKELLKVNFAFHNRVEKKRSIKDVYTLVPLENLRAGRSPREDYIYLNMQDNKLHYTLAGPEKNVLKGTFDLDIFDYKNQLLSWYPDLTSDELCEEIIKKYKNIIYDEARQKGLVHEPEQIQNHLSYSDWKEKAFKDITGSQVNHYAMLTRVLKKLGIEIPFTPKSLDFQGY